jgi:hypothetical protein
MKRVDVGSGAELSMRLEERREYFLDGNLKNAAQVLESPSGTTTWKLAQKADDDWVLSVVTGGDTSARNVGRVVSGLQVECRIQTAVLDASAYAGQSWVDTVFDLMSARHIVVKTTCVSVPSKPGDLWVFVNIDESIKREERWEMDSLGHTVLSEVAPVFTARRENRLSSSGNPVPVSGIADIAGQFAIAMDRPPRENETVEVIFSGGVSVHESVRDLYDSAGPNFRVRKMACRCKMTSVNTKPAKTGKGGQAGDSLLLCATATVQSTTAPIQNLAGKLGAGKSGVCEIIEAMNGYVFNSLEKRNVATFSSALETLDAGFGDCGEHAVLLTALLRASGVPSRVVYGLVFAGSKRGYLYHAWVQARTDQWLNIDPALGVFPACSGYVPLMVDNTGENYAYLATVIDRIKLNYVSLPAKNGNK